MYPVLGHVITLCTVLQNCKYLLKINYMDHMKNVSLKISNFTNIVHQYYFNIYKHLHSTK
jgi:hypothetical protein